jgi:CybS, succinate dehydrogenase cytochrome B small subunit
MTFGFQIAIYKGSVNESTTFSPADRSHGSYHWTFERLLAAGLVPLTGAAFVTSGSSTPLLDGLLCLSLIVYNTPIFYFCFLTSLIPPPGFSLTVFLWITFISASSLSWARCSARRCALRQSPSEWACTNSTRMISVRDEHKPCLCCPLVD